jgi:hypothetical protein
MAMPDSKEQILGRFRVLKLPVTDDFDMVMKRYKSQAVIWEREKNSADRTKGLAAEQNLEYVYPLCKRQRFDESIETIQKMFWDYAGAMTAAAPEHLIKVAKEQFDFAEDFAKKTIGNGTKRPDPPELVSHLTAELHAKHVKLTWNRPLQRFDNLSLIRQEVGTSDKLTLLTNKVRDGYVDKKVAPGKSYIYKVYSCYQSFSSGNATEINVSIPGVLEPTHTRGKILGLALAVTIISILSYLVVRIASIERKTLIPEPPDHPAPPQMQLVYQEMFPSARDAAGWTVAAGVWREVDNHLVSDVEDAQSQNLIDCNQDFKGAMVFEFEVLLQQEGPYVSCALQSVNEISVRMELDLASRLGARSILFISGKAVPVLGKSRLNIERWNHVRLELQKKAITVYLNDEQVAKSNLPFAVGSGSYRPSLSVKPSSARVWFDNVRIYQISPSKHPSLPPTVTDKMLPPTPPPQRIIWESQQTKVFVGASDSVVNTDITVDTSDSLFMSALGEMQINLDGARCGPAGLVANVDPSETALLRMTSAPRGALIARVGERSDWFLVGAGVQMLAGRSGTVYVAANQLGDKQGVFEVLIIRKCPRIVSYKEDK